MPPAPTAKWVFTQWSPADSYCVVYCPACWGQFRPGFAHCGECEVATVRFAGRHIDTAERAPTS